MNNNAKFDKLRLRKSSRKPNSQICQFFEQCVNAEDCTSTKPESNELDGPPLKKLREEEEEDTMGNSQTKTENIIVDKKNSEQNKSLPSGVAPFLLPQIKSKQKTENETRTSIYKFFNQSNDDFKINRIQKKQSRKIGSTRNTKKSKNKTGKKQMKVKSAFLKNEKVFSEFIAQHSIAENVNPDELQLALALSKSEVELSTSSTPITKENDLAGSQQISSNNIKVKLEEFGFKTTTNDRDYNVPIYLQGKNRKNWAYKFTPLTLRNPERQVKKLEGKVDQFLSRQFSTINGTCTGTPFTLISSFLQRFESKSKLIQKLHSNDGGSMSDFYVLDLFIPSKVKIGHLLKDYRKIPGRDLSPISKGRSLNENVFQEILLNEDRLVLSADSTINHTKESLHYGNYWEDFVKIRFGNIRNDSLSSGVKADNKGHVEGSSACNINQIDCIFQKSQCSDIEPEARKTFSENEFVDFTKAKDLTVISLSEKEYSGQSSPDLFAECEQNSSEDYLKDQSNEILNTEENGKQDNVIISYEKYSSEEVKISKTKYNEIRSLSGNTDKTKRENPSIKGNTIDLTSNSDSTADYSIKESERSINSIYADRMNDIYNQNCSHQLSQQSSTDDSCIILSDDEVNYSIKATNKNSDNLVDLTFSSSSEETDLNYDGSKKKEEIASAERLVTSHNFSFIQLVGEEDLESDDKSEDSLDFQSTLNTHQKISEANAPTFVKKNLSFSHSITIEDNKKNYVSSLNESLNEQQDFPEYGELNFSQTSRTTTDYKQNIQSFQTNLFSLDRSIEKCSPLNSGYSNLTFLNKASSNDSLLSTTDKYFTEVGGEVELNESCSNLEQLQAQFGEAVGKVNCSRKELSFRKSAYNKTVSDSIIKQEIITKSRVFKRYSSCRKFNAFTEEDIDFSDVDEIDKLVHGSPIKKSMLKNPEGIDKLINAELSFAHIGTPRKFVHDNKVYLVKTKNSISEPDYDRMDSPTRLKELYKYGLKPLKKNQAVKILEYIYDSTHPFIVEKDACNDEDQYKTVKHSFITADNIIVPHTSTEANQKYNKLKLRDCFAKNFLQHDGLIPEVERDDYIFQTNTRTKIPTVLLPFHIAWFNLVKSNNDLQEAILHYEAIDLQEIYLFFKRLGYRYDPKDMKKFFDKRCILFRYDLSEGASNRHIRGSRKTLSQKGRMKF